MGYNYVNHDRGENDVTPDRCIDCGILADELFCNEDESQCRCADCERDYWNERELLEDDNPADIFTPRNEG